MVKFRMNALLTAMFIIKLAQSISEEILIFVVFIFETAEFFDAIRLRWGLWLL